MGIPLLFASAAAAVGFSVYFSIGVVADRGLGLTPLIFLGAGLMFALTTMTYVEGGAMFRERGGSSMFASHAFNELLSFIAGWAILIDYLIVIAAAAITVPHYLSPIAEGLSDGGAEMGIAAIVIALAAGVNVIGVTGVSRQARLVVLAAADLALQLAVIVIGAIVVFDPALLTDQLDLFTSPSGEDVIYAFVIATIAYAGIEAASDLAPDVDVDPRDLRRVLDAALILVPLLYACISAVALMALPVRPGPDGPETELSGRYIEEPVLGVVAQFDPAWLADTMRWLVMLVAVPTLIWAASTSMLGLSRHVYSLARARQIPSWAGKLERTYSTPYVAIGIAAVVAVGLAIPGDIIFLAGVYAFGALLATTIAHASIVRLRFSDPERARPYSVPLNVGFRGRKLPLPALLAAVVSGLAWVSVILVPRTGARGRRRLDAVRPPLLCRLPAPRRGNLADGTGVGPGGGAEEAGARDRVFVDPRPGVRNGARRRHRKHGGAVGRRGGGGGRAGATAPDRVRGGGAADGAARRAAAEGRARAG